MIDLSDKHLSLYENGSYTIKNSKELNVKVKANCFAVGRNGPTLAAHGGDCRVITIFDRQSRLGAVIHIAASDLYGEKDVELMAAVINDWKFVNPEVFVCGDIANDDDGLAGLWVEWNEKIHTYFYNLEFNNVQIISDAFGKDVLLNTSTGKVWVFDDDGNQIFHN